MKHVLGPLAGGHQRPAEQAWWRRASLGLSVLFIAQLLPNKEQWGQDSAGTQPGLSCAELDSVAFPVSEIKMMTCPED